MSNLYFSIHRGRAIACFLNLLPQAAGFAFMAGQPFDRFITHTKATAKPLFK